MIIQIVEVLLCSGTPYIGQVLIQFSSMILRRIGTRSERESQKTLIFIVPDLTITRSDLSLDS